MTNTTYRLQSTAGEKLGNVQTSFRQARETAEALTAEQSIEVQVIHRGTEAVAYVTTPVPVGQRFVPWQRIENPKFSAPAFAGFIPAYTRRRIQATAYRAADHTGWLIHDGRSNGTVFVKNTKLGAKTFTEMRKGRVL